MEYVHAVLLLHSAKQPISEENLKKVIAAAGLQVDEARVKAMVAALEGVNIDEAIKSAAVPAIAAPTAPAAPAKAEEKKKEEKVEEKKEEEALAGLGALFG
ncbi:MAG: 50S ribosomal protein P1 [Candidatus Hadarchaeum sp.]|uniref:50S ribosomal protein P1 n=1 Tax=Candidatus Hadarchaeum sp. TaxID=2883567 RepID=UPI00316D74A6